ncbi:hypothetical protein FRUB_00533 [Fimbriiglobus ruber]|uniref:Uncharacterized protein n=1 Tax=Fimbriiglobus ruber TaxID=1908690 RepID=A0A225E503_9BACT|nr:hypothetical protein FRUB_00533 [Fimbriiglobus ruber]
MQFRNPVALENAPQPESPYQQVMQNFATFAVAPDAVASPSLPNNTPNTVPQNPTLVGAMSRDFASFGAGSMLLNPADVLSPGPRLPQPIVPASTTASTLDPDRVQLVRSAYQKALGYQCADQACNITLAEMFKPEPQVLAPIMNPGWVHMGTPYDVPARAAHVAHYGKVSVWVMPEDAQNLAQFTRAISEISTASLHPRGPTAVAGKTVQTKAPIDQIRVIADVYTALPEPADDQQKAEHLLVQMRMYGEFERLASLYSNQPDKRDRFVGNMQQFVDRATKTFEATNAPKAEKDRFKEQTDRLQKELLEHFDSSISPPATAQGSGPKKDSNAIPAIQKTVTQP